MANYIGLDLGTSSLKALIVGEDDVPVATVSASLTVQRPHFGWSEQDPASWIAAAETVMASLAESHPQAMAAVAGIGLSGHMHGATLIGADDAILRPCILWNDTRSHVEAAELDTPEAREITGNIVFPGFTAPKVEWVRRNEADIFALIRRVLLPKDYLRLWLTGETVSEMSDAAGTAWLDTGRRAWSPEMLARTGLTLSHMPRLVEGTQASGTLRPDLAARWSLGRAIVVAGGGGDNAASACGVGVAAPGTGFVSLGTSGVLFTACASYTPRPETALHTFCHAIPGLWHQMGVTLSAAGSLDWLSRLLMEGPAELTARLGETVLPPGRPIFLPYLSGERTPYNDSEIRGVFAGLDAATDRADLVRAVLEGVAFSMRDCLEAGKPGAGLSRLIAVGAGSRSAYWLQLLANGLNVEIALPTAGDFGAALGAARLGLCAATGADPLRVMREPPIERGFVPDAEGTAAFDRGYARYRALYPAVRDAMRAT